MVPSTRSRAKSGMRLPTLVPTATGCAELSVDGGRSAVDTVGHGEAGIVLVGVSGLSVAQPNKIAKATQVRPATGHLSKRVKLFIPVPRRAISC